PSRPVARERRGLRLARLFVEQHRPDVDARVLRQHGPRPRGEVEGLERRRVVARLRLQVDRLPVRRHAHRLDPLPPPPPHPAPTPSPPGPSLPAGHESAGDSGPASGTRRSSPPPSARTSSTHRTRCSRSITVSTTAPGFFATSVTAPVSRSTR